MIRFTFIEVIATEQDALDVRVAAHVIDAVDEAAAFKALFDANSEIEPIYSKGALSTGNVKWNSENNRVTIVKLIPDKQGYHPLANESNG